MSDLRERMSVHNAELIGRPAQSGPWKTVEDVEVSTDPGPT